MRWTPSVLCLVLCLAFQAAGQAPAEKSSSAEAKPSRRPLPTNYGKLGITDAQRDKLVAIQESYEAQLEKMREEMRQVLRERDARMEQELTDGQKLRLKELRAEQRAKAAAPAAPTSSSSIPTN